MAINVREFSIRIKVSELRHFRTIIRVGIKIRIRFRELFNISIKGIKELGIIFSDIRLIASSISDEDIIK